MFHNFHHTQQVAVRAIEIGAHEGLKEDELLIITMAAWFHDTGYLFTDPSGHEAESVKIMTDYLSEKDLPLHVLAEISDCIMATKAPTNPQNLLQSILCDADTYHFGTGEFTESNEKVYLELRLRNNGPDKSTFMQGSAAMLRAHKFYTAYCREMLDAGKKKNLEWLSKSL